MNSHEQNKSAYNQYATDYHAKRNDPAKGFWNRCIENPAMESIIKPICSGKSVLDMGCGAGGLTTKIQQWGGITCGIDISHAMIEIAKSENARIDFQVGDIASTPYDSNTFDIACSSLVLHYFEDINAPIREAARILKPGGTFVFSMHHPFTEAFIDTEDGASPFLVGKYFHNDRYEWKMLDGMILESYHHTFEDISSATSNAGFLIEAISEPRPSADHESINPNAFSETWNYPKFVVIKCRSLKAT